MNDGQTVVDAGAVQHSDLPAKSDLSPDQQISLLSKKNVFLRELADITAEMIERRDVDDLLHQICRRLLDISGAVLTYIAIKNRSGDYLDVVLISDRAGGVQSPQRKIYPGQGAGGRAWAEKKTVHIQNYQKHGLKIGQTGAIVEACSIPIQHKHKRYGVVTLLFDHSPGHVLELLELYEKFAQTASLVLHNAERQAQRNEQVKMLNSMLKINQAIYEANDHLEIMDAVCRMSVESFNSNRTRIYRYENCTLVGLTGVIRDDGVTLPEQLPSAEIMNESIVMWCVRNLRAAHLPPGTSDPRESARLHTFRRDNDIGCSYVVPLICEGQPWGAYTVHRPIGSPDFTDEEKKLIDLVASQLSLTIYRQQLMDRIESQANFDELTGLYNRARFENVMRQRVEQSRADHGTVSMLFIDLNGFKGVNDTLGHDVGDDLLRLVAKRLLRFAVNGVIVGRLGGDEFAVLTPNDFGVDDALHLARKINDSVGRPYEIEGISFNTTASIGMAHYPQHADSYQSLRVSADIAMYQAKKIGAGVVCEYDPVFASDHKRRFSLRKKLEHAIDNQELYLLFQPKVCARSARVIGAEALVRWDNEDFATVSPSEWIPLAEELGLMVDIDRWVLREACTTLNHLIDRSIELKLSVNVSTTQFAAEDFVQTTMSIIQSSGAPASMLELEITETVLIEGMDDVMGKLARLREAGLTISIDDFGIKYSSLAYLADLPVDVVKIDREFVKRLDQTSRRSMVEPIILLAKSLGMQTVVEGVETQSQLDYVCSVDCDVIQGFYYSRPVDLDEFIATVNRINVDAEAMQQDKAA